MHLLYSSYRTLDKNTVDPYLLRPALEKKWNFLLKHSTGNLQEISIEIYCSKTVVIPYLGNFKCQGHFLASVEISNFMHFFCIQNTWNFLEISYGLCISQFKGMWHLQAFPIRIWNFTCYVNFLSLGHVTFIWHFLRVSEISPILY